MAIALAAALVGQTVVCTTRRFSPSRRASTALPTKQRSTALFMRMTRDSLSFSGRGVPSAARHCPARMSDDIPSFEARLPKPLGIQFEEMEGGAVVGLVLLEHFPEDPRDAAAVTEGFLCNEFYCDGEGCCASSEDGSGYPSCTVAGTGHSGISKCHGQSRTIK